MNKNLTNMMNREKKLLEVYNLKEMFTYEADTGIFRYNHEVYAGKNIEGRPILRKKIGSIKRTHTSSAGYQIFEIEKPVRIRIAASRVAWYLYHGEFPNGFIDHINHDRSDNRIENLRVVAHIENIFNKKIKSNCGEVGIRELSYKGTTYYTAKLNGKHLGTFKTKEAAVNIRKVAESILYPGINRSIYYA